MRLIIVVGARPNFIKVGPLMPVLAEAGHDARLAHTGQHYDDRMSDVFFTDLDIPKPSWFLGVGSGTHAVQTGTAMMRLEELFAEETPDAVMVVGDVNSTLAGALAASKLGIPVMHLEAGLRSFDMSMPEEINRLVTDQIAAAHLTPTREADENLSREGVASERVSFVGNIMAESLLAHAPAARSRNVCDRFELEPGRFVLATIHRPENTDHPERLAAVVAAFAEAPLPVIFPVHPRTRPLLEAAGAAGAAGVAGPAGSAGDSNLLLIDPIGYLDMLSLQSDAAAIVTDSGGVQEESCMLGTPCVTVRRNTERGITVAVGANRLVSAEREAILSGLAEVLNGSLDWELPERWDGEVSRRVAQALEAGIVPLAGC